MMLNGAVDTVTLAILSRTGLHTVAPAGLTKTWRARRDSENGLSSCPVRLCLTDGTERLHYWNSFSILYATKTLYLASASA